MGFCATGVLMAVKSLHHSAAASILGLGTLNPYVATAVSGWDKVNAPRAMLPRELGANAARQRDSLQAAGASSFGMSGVNAHVLVTNAVFGAPVHESTAKQWRRSRSVALLYVSPSLRLSAFLCMDRVSSLIRSLLAVLLSSPLTQSN